MVSARLIHNLLTYLVFLHTVSDLRRLSPCLDYLFDEAEDKTAGKTKYDQIMDDVKSLLAKYPDHKVYTTGHSLGGALATLCGFYLATEEDLPKPVSSINFAAPRVGGGSFHKAVLQLEKERLFRLCRSVNENDTVTTIPPGAFKHVGFQVTAAPPRFWNSTPEPDIAYISPNPTFLEGLWYRWTNGVLSNLNLGYDHGMGEYLKCINTAKPILEATSLNQLYMHQKSFQEEDAEDV
jgi:pimeloyl-ACP methyl ester carboxylesterase